MSIMSERVTQTQVQHPATAVPTIGVIRPGYKRLIKKHASNPEVVKIAESAFAHEISFLEAEKMITKAFPSITKAFVPYNTVHFNMHASDFVGGHNAVNKLIALYGQKLPGDEVAKLYRFPIVFPDVGSADAALPVRFEMHVGMKYKSQDNTDGGRSCIFLPPIDPQEVQKQRANRIKQVARREWAIRGPCVPESCPEFAAGDCKLKGSLQFFIPGLTGLGVVKMPSGSSYALEKIWTQLNNLHKTIGKIPNFDNHGQPVFYLTKKQEERAYVDPETGEAKRGLQWVPALEANIDSSVIMQIQEQQRQIAMTTSMPNQVVLPGPSAWKAQEPAAAEQSQTEVVLTPMQNMPEDVRNAFIDYVTAKHGKEFVDSDLMKQDNAVADGEFAFFNAMTGAVEADSVINVLKIYTLTANHQMDMQKMVKPFLVKLFGKTVFKTATNSSKALAELNRILESGKDAALIHIESKLN